MDVSKPIELARLDEINILKNIRLIHNHDLNPIYSKDNLRVQFDISGEIKGTITCYLCLDNMELSETDKEYLFPLFIESMNILVGRQISLDAEFTHFKISMSSPKFSLIPKEINTASRKMTQKYDLQIEDIYYSVLTEYHLEAIS